MSENGTEPKPEDREMQVGERLENGFIYCGCPDETPLWPLTDLSTGFTVFQCSVCKRNVGIGYARKRESPLIVPGKRFN